jgi:molybdopterin-guanine dinucleotide biosynthesis protein A
MGILIMEDKKWNSILKKEHERVLRPPIGLILCAGNGTRFMPKNTVEYTPKPLVDWTNNKTLLQHNIEFLEKAGCDTIFIIIKKKNKEQYQGYNSKNVKFFYFNKSNGTGNAIYEFLKKHKKFRERKILTIWGDSYRYLNGKIMFDQMNEQFQTIPNYFPSFVFACHREENPYVGIVTKDYLCSLSPLKKNKYVVHSISYNSEKADNYKQGDLHDLSTFLFDGQFVFNLLEKERRYKRTIDSDVEEINLLDIVQTHEREHRANLTSSREFFIAQVFDTQCCSFNTKSEYEHLINKLRQVNTNKQSVQNVYKSLLLN